MSRIVNLTLLAGLGLSLAAGLGACTRASVGKVTGPATGGAQSSAPDAVDQASGGVTSGGANAFTPAQKKTTPSPQP